MKNILFSIFLLSGCAGKRMHGIDMNSLTGSPCVDGTIYNVKQAGCEVFYWGQTQDTGIKLRCSYADHDNFYTTTSFFAVPLGQPLPLAEGYFPWCADSQAMVYAKQPKNEPKRQNN